MRLSPVPFALKTEVVRVCLSRNRKVPAYRKREQLNSTLPNLWLFGRVLDRTVVLVSMLTRVRVALLMVPPLESVLYSTKTLALLRASWKEGHILIPAKAKQERDILHVHFKEIRKIPTLMTWKSFGKTHHIPRMLAEGAAVRGPVALR